MIHHQPQKISQTVHPKITLTDLDFADDIAVVIALLSGKVDQAQEMFHQMQAAIKESKRVGLGLNAKKTKYLTYNIPNPDAIRTLESTQLERKEDFKYLGSWIS